MTDETVRPTFDSTPGAGQRLLLIPYPFIIGIATIVPTIHLLLGTSPEVAILTFFIFFLSGITFNYLGGGNNIVAILFARLISKNFIISHFAKIVFLQPSDTNLQEPTTTFLVIFMGVLSFFLAAIILRTFTKPGQKPGLHRPLQDPPQLLFVAYLALIVGMICHAAMHFFPLELKTAGYGFALFGHGVDIILLAVACTTARQIILSGFRRTVDVHVLVTFFVTLLLGIAWGTRYEMMKPVYAYAAILLFFRFPIKIRHFLVSAAALLFFFLFVKFNKLIFKAF